MCIMMVGARQTRKDTRVFLYAHYHFFKTKELDKPSKHKYGLQAHFQTKYIDIKRLPNQ